MTHQHWPQGPIIIAIPVKDIGNGVADCPVILHNGLGLLGMHTTPHKTNCDRCSCELPCLGEAAQLRI